MLFEFVKSVETTNKSSFIQNRNKVYILFVFAISPFISLLISIRNYKTSWAKNVVWLFVAFYGYTMVISNKGMDANSYRDKFYQISEANLTFGDFFELLYSENSNYVDIIQPLTTFIVSKFATDHRILFLVFALIFGFFYSRNIWYLLDRTGQSLKKETIPLIITFAFIIGFWQINGFRMWTAAHVFFYGAIRFIYDRKKNGLFLAAVSMLIHFSFILPVLIILTYTLSKNRVILYFWIFIATFFITEINLSFVKESLNSITPDIFQDKVNAYTSVDYIENKRENVQNWSWHAQYYGRALKWVVIVFMSVMYFKGLNFIKNSNSLLSLYCFALLFLAIANVVSLMPSGGRFFSVANLFAIAAIFLYIQHAPKKSIMRKLMPLAIPALSLYCIVALRIGFDTIGAVTILGNPFIATFIDIDIALIEFLK